MKNKFFLTFLTLSTLFFSACSKDSVTTNDCIPINCLNGGVSNSNCGCDCPQGYSGANCAIQLTPTKVKIKKFKIKFFSNTTSTGGYWDGLFLTTASYPDIFFMLKNSSGQSIYVSSTYYEDAIANGTNVYTFTPTTPIEISDVNNIYTLSLCDLDGSNYEIMHSAVFSPYNSVVGFSATRTIGDSTIPYIVDIDFEYQWN